MAPVRIGVIGLGNIGRHHAGYLAEGKVDGAALAAVCTSSREKAARFQAARMFSDPVEMYRSGAVDAVLIATPHYPHSNLGIAAFDHGLHVLMEKPISAHKSDAERLIAARQKHPEACFGAMFQFRLEPKFAHIHGMLQREELGRILRVAWIMTDWYRTEAYYASSGWRATWRGEGSGVLLNQCPHGLDILQWLTGMPERVRGFCHLGQHHDIEVEDQATAYLEYRSGATGMLVASTGEHPGTNRLELAGTKGRLILENDRMLITRNAVESDQFSRQAHLGFAHPETTTEERHFTSSMNPHLSLTQNFVNAIRGKEPLIAPGEDGLRSLELANAILYSSLAEKTVDLPLDGAVYERTLRALEASSRKQKKEVVPISGEDITSSFKK